MNLLAWIKTLFTKTTKEPTMADTASTAAAAPAVPETPAIVETTAIDTDKLKALLITLGHDIEAEWEHLVALAKKAA
ncbi:hypothetical protein [Pseudomonas typographi]|uniref:Uncharacterized protein n=1 Tax=Pseudomonas typographi TaxID=2715964 RepID=A0ABR7ZAE0_9PSED|nr:hypothetical protein [Pseudomonas typographi]MBD1589771.1 hypothetical protein [Pseudomonas typographi]MBD1601173.1 hypothetical protein [Pseudomonas typographi]MBD1602343.1 hypothetical protein [Pseudomonas typographi]